MLKRFVSQKPAPPIREEPRNPVPDDNHHFASREETPPKPTIIDNPNPKPNPMADHGGKDILSSDVEIKGSIKFQKELLIEPLIWTSLERMSLPPWSAIGLGKDILSSDV